MNIAGNAVKFSETGVVALSVAAVRPPDAASGCGLRFTMHGLRGAAATLGADEVARCAARLEAVLTASDRDTVAAEAAALVRALSVAAAVGAAGIGA